MRLTKLALTGYGRFQSATCNVDRKVIAFIGPNEAGKSTLLRALEWLSNEDGERLPKHLKNRAAPPASNVDVVSGIFLLDDDELRIIADLDVATREDRSVIKRMSLTLSKRANGSRHIEFEPQLSRDPAPFEDLLSAINRARLVLEEDGSNLSAVALEQLQTVEGVYPAPDETWTVDRSDQLFAAASALQSELDTAAAETPEGEVERDQGATHEVIVAIQEAARAAARPEPIDAARSALADRIPRFVLFTDRDRELPERFDINVDVTVPNGLRNLLQVAGTSVDGIRAAIEGGQTPHRTLERTVRRNLESVREYWSQSDLVPHVAIGLDGIIDVSIDDAEGVTAVNERSEGLQAFLALVCFLLTTAGDAPPVLLIDEAERNLHYDAQGDLVRLLTNQLDVSRVIYTTHSPGCLPLDLGNGIRVVARTDSDPTQSRLLNNFWTDEEPGFSRLLFAMGAGAAAFSALNKALLTEGATEMILLPTLLNAALPDSPIDFQVSFGLSNMSIPDDLGQAALLTSYLVDGDEEGDKKIKQLREYGVPKRNLLQLPHGKALEDLLDRDYYLDVVDQVNIDAKRSIVDRSKLDPRHTIAKAVDMLADLQAGFKPPGHKIVAARVANEPEVVLSNDGATYLRETLWPALEAAFAKPYVLRSRAREERQRQDRNPSEP